MKVLVAAITCLCLLCCVTGCTSNFTMLLPTPPENFEKMGSVEASAISSIWGLIPVAETIRTQRAVDRALAKAPGATSLINVTLQEDWCWFYLGTARRVTISGDAVK